VSAAWRRTAKPIAQSLPSAGGPYPNAEPLRCVLDAITERRHAHVTLEDAVAGVDAIFERFADRRLVPGFAWGVIVDGQLVRTGAGGTCRLGEDAVPDADTVFRIASMTKSFTASTVLLLRDEGRLSLDDPVADWVPEVATLTGPTADCARITIRHLLTMSSGLPTDDPWGDRQQGLPLERFAALLRGGMGMVWPPDTRFEYSNLGYGILGRVVTRAAGTEYDEVVRRRFLEPLGMTSTTYHPERVPDERLALGYVRRDDAWIAEPIDPYGALAPMGGVLTTVNDLARWVAGFTAAFPARDDPDDGHPLSRATRREMQQIHRVEDPELRWSSAEATPDYDAGGYGYGLFVWQDLRLGRVVGHGGGYPGYGSHMRWHPATGIGVIGFSNCRYGPVVFAVREALAALIAAEPGRSRRPRPWPETEAARATVERLLVAWDDVVAARLFAMNIELDEPLELRRRAIEQLRATHGALAADDRDPPVSDSPAHLAWWLRGERGRVRVEILLSPERPPRVQKLAITSVPEPPAGLRAIAERVVELLGRPGPAWPDDLPVANSVDRVALGRTLRAAEAVWGPVTLGPEVGGDGRSVGRWRLRGVRSELELELALDDAGSGERADRLARVVLVPRPIHLPIAAT
jgi:CubicO group peptidase (beta-lactamase class C family)